MLNKIRQKCGIDLVMFFSGLVMLLTGTSAIIGWITGERILASIYSNYIPMAISTAVIFIVFGVLFISNLLDGSNQKIKPYIVTIMILISVSGLLHFLGYFLHRDLTIEDFFISHQEKLGRIPINKMSHYSGLLFFISAIAALLKLLGKDQKMLSNFIGNLGIIVSFAGLTATLGYTFGSPFLYSGDIIPLAFTSAISFIFLGLGILTLAGEKHFLVRKLTGKQASARILRTFLPFLILENVIGDSLEQYISHNYDINEAFISAVVSLTSIIIATILTLYLTKIIFKSADKAEIERLKAEEALKESLELQSTLLKTIPFGMDIIDEHGTILFLNEKMSQSLGNDALGKKCWEVYRDDRTQCVDCPIKRNIKIGETHITESQDVLGGRIFEIIHTGLIFNGKKALLEIFHDITDRKNSEIRLKEFAGVMEVANNTKNKLFSIIAHDLRSPFNSILGLTNLLNDNYSTISEEDQKLIVAKLKESSENAFNLLDNLLAWSLAQREGIKVNPEKIDLSEIASLQLEVFETLASSKNIQIENQIARLTHADADRNMITTVMRNLMNNALKFTHSGGSIVIAAFELNNKIEVSITDTGVGISEEVLNDIFKSNDTHTTNGTANEKGTGLGLMVCKEFVEINGGEIRVDSVEGKGSRFSFTLPASILKETTSIN